MKFKMFKNTYVREVDGKPLQVDKSMVNDCLSNYSQFDDLEGAIVMDWGANIGGFGRMLMDKPIEKYIGVECHPENFEVLKKNVGDLSKFELINAAVTNLPLDQDTGKINLYLTGSKQEFCSGTTNPKSDIVLKLRKKKVSVSTVNGNFLLEKYKPTHFKCDIEGEEYRMFDPDWIIPKCVKQLSMELHWVGDKRVLSKYENVIRKSFMEQGFTPLQEKLLYATGDAKKGTFLGESISYRNIWGLDTFWKR